MKTLNFELTTSTIYGHILHLWVAEKALNAGIIAINEFESLKKYAALIFSGRRMNEQFSKAMNTVNNKVFVFDINSNRELKKELVAKKVAKEINAKNYLDVIVYLGVENSNEFEAINDNTDQKITGTINIENEIVININ